MPIFETMPLEPNLYETRHGMLRFSKDDFRRIGTNTKKAIRCGKTIPVLMVHDDTSNGDPFDPQSVNARQCEGKIVDAKVNRDGKLRYVFEVPDTATDVVQRLRDGRIQFSSPSFGHFRDTHEGRERDFGVMTRHLALTPFPKETNQPPIREVVNFSEATNVPVEIQTKIKSKVKPEMNVLEQAPGTDRLEPATLQESASATSPPIDDVQVNELLAASGIMSPAVKFTDNPTQWMQQFIGALQNRVAHLTATLKTSGQVSSALTPESIGTVAYNFSEHADESVRKLYADFQRVKNEQAQRVRDAALSSIRQRVERQQWLPQDVRVGLLNRVDTLNFSEGADGATIEAPSFTASEVMDLVEKAVPENVKLGPNDVVEEQHPSGDKFFTKEGVEDGEEMTLAEAEAEVDKFMKASYFESKV